MKNSQICIVFVRNILFVAALLLSFSSFTQDMNTGIEYRESIEQNYPQLKEGNFLFVSLKSQKMYRFRNWETLNVYTISGAKAGAGCKSGSNQTPIGLHFVAEKYGDEVPLGGILKARKYTGEIAEIYTDDTDVNTDFVTTRILWLKGEEKGINLGGNTDSYSRYIYIHGTPEEGLLGRPASHGCIRMKNQEVIDLYNETQTGEKVLILNQ